MTAGNDVAAGKEGEIIDARAQHRFCLVISNGRQQLNVNVFSARVGGSRTGDLAIIDDEGFIKPYRPPQKDIIIRGRRKYFPGRD